MNLEIAKFVWMVLVSILSGGAFVMGWFGRRNEQLNQHDRRISLLEQQVTQGPDADDMDALRAELHGVAQQLAKLEGTSQSVERAVERIHAYLMEKGK